ncbi:hypothetical protein ACHAXH_006011 [Discostella pseudostelligera]
MKVPSITAVIALISTVAGGGRVCGGCDAFSSFIISGGRRITSSSSSSSTIRWNGRILHAAVVTSEDDSAAATDVDDDANVKSLTQRIMERASSASSSGAGGAGAGSASTWEAFQRTEANWARLKSSSSSSTTQSPSSMTSSSMPLFITDDGARGNPKCWEKLRNTLLVDTNDSSTKLDYDITICGGTLGIFIATALLAKNPSLRLSVIESAKLRGRDQEWNISRKELEELAELGVLTEQDLEVAITTEFPGCRAGFKNQEVTPLDGSYFDNGEIGYECYIPNVLNLGVSPSVLIENVAARFRSMGGTILENCALRGIAISESIGAALELHYLDKQSSIENDKDGGDNQSNDDIITTKLVLDCMGNASPISRQQRFGRKPDGVCAVVGTCAGGFEKETNLIGDIIYTNTEIQVINEKRQSNCNVENGKLVNESRLQYFWEAFPVGIGGSNGMEPGTSDVKTTYMFTYMDASEGRPSLSTLMDDYWQLLPIYQPSITDVEDDLDVKRVLFAYFPTYRDSPLRPQWSRLLAVGDASGIQSPLSFGGFGALTRHLGRISSAVVEALEHDLLHKDDLGMINAYAPNLSAAWMFQKAMSVRIGQKVDPKFVNRLLATNFEVMHNMGVKSTMMPFLQDVVRIDGLVGSLARSFVADPSFMPQIVAHVGIPTLVEWLGHVGMIATYHALHTAVSPILEPIVESTMKNDPRERYIWRRRIEAWKFGSGNDYVFEEEDK